MLKNTVIATATAACFIGVTSSRALAPAPLKECGK